ncbi:MAG: serine/threonine-protein kinase [Polyangiales bacterium]
MLLANKYRLQKRLGAGGMGEVYRAVNESIGRPVAIKILRPELLRNEDVVQRFLREAKAATLVRHANVVDVLDVLDHDGIPFMVQELLSGEDLADYVESRGGKLPLDALLSVMIPVIEAVGAAHSKGVVHRDLKPANVFLHSADGEIVPKVLDFGISKITTGDATRVTTTGTALGTPAYMSPEQIEGLAHVDARSDVWSLGVMLFELAAGTRPFLAETPGALFVKIATTPARSLSDACPECPEPLVAIVARCLRAQKSDRYEDARALASALRSFAETQPIKLRDSLQSLRPRVSLVSLDEGATLEPTMDEAAPKPIVAATRAAAVETQAPHERVSQTNDLGPVSGRLPSPGKHKPKRRWAILAISFAFVATGAVFVVGRARSTATIPDPQHTANSDRAQLPGNTAPINSNNAHDADASALVTADAAPATSAAQSSATIESTADAAVTAQNHPDANDSNTVSTAHNNAGRTHRRVDHGENNSAEPLPQRAHEPIDSGVPRIRGATTYE